MKLAAALSVLLFAAIASGDTLPVSIQPDDAKLYYIGRADTRDPAGPRMAWPASSVTIRFKGTDLQAKVKDNGKNAFAVSIDGGEATTVKPGAGENVIDVAKGLSDGEHMVTLTKRSEAHGGFVQFQGFYVSAGGELLEPVRKKHRIEVIGDSISCGYGNEAPDQKTKFSYDNSDASRAYGALAAKAVDAEYVGIAWSGKRLAEKNTMTELYDRAIPTDPASKWDASKWTADVVLINLATNDFNGNALPDKDKFIAAYKELIGIVRKNYPDAHIYLASGSMMNDGHPPGLKALSNLKDWMTTVETDLEAQGVKNLHQIHFAPQDGQVDGLGADWHPNLKTHQKMANHFVATLKSDLGW